MAGATLRTMLSIVPGSRGVGSLTFTVTEGNCPFKRPDTASASSRRFSIDRSSRRSFNVEIYDRKGTYYGLNRNYADNDGRNSTVADGV